MEQFTVDELRRLNYIVGTSPAFPSQELKPLREKVQNVYTKALAIHLKEKPKNIKMES